VNIISNIQANFSAIINHEQKSIWEKLLFCLYIQSEIKRTNYPLSIKTRFFLVLSCHSLRRLCSKLSNFIY